MYFLSSVNADYVNPKRSESKQATSAVKTKRGGLHTPVASIHATHLQIKREGATGHDEDEEGRTLWQFRPDVLPEQRQTFYCVCDILVDEVQELLHSNDGQVSRGQPTL